MTSSKDDAAAAAIKDLLKQSPHGLREVVRTVVQGMLKAHFYLNMDDLKEHK